MLRASRRAKLTTLRRLSSRWVGYTTNPSQGMPAADVHNAMTNLDAIAVLQGLIRPGDIILIKGSRSLGMESIVDALSRPNSSGSVRPGQTGRVN